MKTTIATSIIIEALVFFSLPSLPAAGALTCSPSAVVASVNSDRPTPRRTESNCVQATCIVRKSGELTAAAAASDELTSCSNCSDENRSASPPSFSDSTSDAMPRKKGHFS